AGEQRSNETTLAAGSERPKSIQARTPQELMRRTPERSSTSGVSGPASRRRASRSAFSSSSPWRANRTALPSGWMVQHSDETGGGGGGEDGVGPAQRDRRHRRGHVGRGAPRAEEARERALEQRLVDERLVAPAGLGEGQPLAAQLRGGARVAREEPPAAARLA